LNGVDPLGRGRRIQKLAITPAPAERAYHNHVNDYSTN
jgi:hypothetical protein